MPWLRTPNNVLLPAIRGGVALLLLTPLVVTPGTAHPFVVGKAVFSRSVIEVVFALWVVLAVARPVFRPPRSLLLALLAAGLAAAGLSACFGVSPQRSLWSTYGRMQGVVDLAHGLALAVVLASVMRTGREWRVLLTVNVGAAAAVALLAIARYHGVDLPLFGALPEPHFPRIGGTLGNATFLGGYMQIGALVALGLLARSLIPPAPPNAARGGWPGRLLLAAGAVLMLWALSLSGSLGALAGLVAGAGFVAAMYALSARARKARLAAMGFLGGLAAAGTLALVLVFASGASPRFDNPLLQRVASARRIESSLGKRLANWEAGVKGFAERPLLGWGPANYLVPYARHTAGLGPTTIGRDHAHSQIIEEAATKGLVGLAVYIALWAFTIRAIVRAARAADARERALAVFVGGALLGYFVQSQTLFATPVSSLQHVLLLAFAVQLERSAQPAWHTRARMAALAAAARGGWQRKAARAGVVAAALALSGAGLAANHAIHTGAAALYQAETSRRFMHHLERAIRAFDPLATEPRIILFDNLASNWPVLHARRRAEADRLLEWAKVEAPAALAAEPESWRVHHALARMCRAVAATNPEFTALAEQHLRRSRALSPNIDPLAPVIRPR